LAALADALTDTPAAAGDAADAAAAAAPSMAPVVFSEADWQALAQLLQLCVHWYAAGELPQQLVQLMIEVRYVCLGQLIVEGSQFVWGLFACKFLVCVGMACNLSQQLVHLVTEVRYVLRTALC
jgi:hypothetical protein